VLLLLRLVPWAVLGALVALLLWLFVFVGTSHPKHADAIVVLAGNSGRVTTGMRLHREGIAPVLAVSVDETTDIRRAPVCRGRRVVCFHASPFSTRGEAETFSRIARRRGWRRVVIVSSRFHLRRARMLFHRCTEASLQVVPSHTSLWQYLTNIPLELGKLLVQVTVVRGC
jgi:uncharacterized SAM-binding protein YcdF (DUF218 family)